MKSTLDSWVRWEGQVKQKQQKELADSVMATIEKELSNESTLKRILDQSVKDVERTLLLLHHLLHLLTVSRYSCHQGVAARYCEGCAEIESQGQVRARSCFGCYTESERATEEKERRVNIDLVFTSKATLADLSKQGFLSSSAHSTLATPQSCLRECSACKFRCSVFR